MDFEMEDVEFDLNEVVEDVEMDDDELNKELKQIEKENESKLLEKENESKLLAENASKYNKERNVFENTEIKKKGNHKRRRGKEKVDFKTFCDDLETNGRHRSHHDDNYKSRSQRSDMYQEKMIDYKRLNRSLHVSKTSDPMIVGREIAYRLHEPKTALFGHVVRVLGFNMASQIFAESKEIVNRGGIKTDSGDRRRSPGGTFLYVMKNRCYATPEQVKEIFKEDNEAKKQHKKKVRQQYYEHKRSDKYETESVENVEKNESKDKKETQKVECGEFICDEVKTKSIQTEELKDGDVETKAVKTRGFEDEGLTRDEVEAKDIKTEELKDGELMRDEVKIKGIQIEELEDGEITCSAEESAAEIVT